MGRPNAELLKSAAVAALGSFLFGFDTAVISGTTDALRLRFSLSEAQLGFTVASALLGTILGSRGLGGTRGDARPPAGAAGPGRALLRLRLGCALAWDWLSLVVFRFVGGLAIGGSSVVAPMYIAEIAPARRARAARGPQPAQRRQRNPVRVPLQLLHRADRWAARSPRPGASCWASRPCPPPSSSCSSSASPRARAGS